MLRRSPVTIPRRKAAGRVLLRFVPVLAGILLISTAYQYALRLSGPAILMDLIHITATSTDKTVDEQSRQYLQERLGLDRPFVPDLWPFDNESLWD